MADSSDRKEKSKSRCPGPDDADGRARLQSYYVKKLDESWESDAERPLLPKVNRTLQRQNRPQWSNEDHVQIWGAACDYSAEKAFTEGGGYSEEWPKDCPSADDPQGQLLLKNFFRAVLKESYPEFWDFIIRGLNLELRKSGRKEWNHGIAKFVFDAAVKDNERADEAEYQRERAEETSHGGRKPTPRSRRRDAIRDALGIGKSWAYDIERDGTSNLADRVTLAAAFEHDPNWNRPVHWEPRNKQRRRGAPSVDLTMRAFVLAQADAFELATPALEKLAALYGDGEWPDDFADVEAFIAAARPVGIGVAPAFEIWESLKTWRIKAALGSSSGN